MPSLSVRTALKPGGRIGPARIALLEAIAAHGSISAAGRALGMSYRRAWELVEETGAIFGSTVAARQIGGRSGGGATLTPFGTDLVRRYRSVEKAVKDAARASRRVAGRGASDTALGGGIRR